MNEFRKEQELYKGTTFFLLITKHVYKSTMIRSLAFFSVFLILYLVVVLAISRESERLSTYHRRLAALEDAVRLAEAVTDC